MKAQILTLFSDEHPFRQGTRDAKQVFFRFFHQILDRCKGYQ
jgi:hypothetical protein